MCYSFQSVGALIICIPSFFLWSIHIVRHLPCSPLSSVLLTSLCQQNVKLNNLQSSNSEKLTTDGRISKIQWDDGGYFIMIVDGNRIKVEGTWVN